MVFGDGAPAFGCRQHGRSEPLGKAHELLARPGPQQAETGDQDRPLRDRKHVEGRLEVRAIGIGAEDVRLEGDLAASSPASRVVSLCGSSKCTGPGGRAMVSRMARRTCWRTLIASIVVLHLTIGA